MFLFQEACLQEKRDDITEDLVFYPMEPRHPITRQTGGDVYLPWE